VMVTFFDLRDADCAKTSLNGMSAGDKVIDIHYSIPKDSSSKEQQQGCVLLQTTAEDEEIRAVLVAYGDVKDIRPAKDIRQGKCAKIIEFFDVRQADAFLLHHRVELAGQVVAPKPVAAQNFHKGSPQRGVRNQRPRSQSHEVGHGANTGGGTLWQPDGGTGRSVPRDNRSSDRGTRLQAIMNPTPEQFVFEPARVLGGQEKRTTLMIKNIPNKYNQKMLLGTFEEQHRGSFDFIYLPIDFKNWCNVGYAFINFVKPEESVRFYENFHGKRWKHFNSEKICQISYARIQGKQMLIDHFQTSNLLGEDKRCRPMIFEDGHPAQFPAVPATRKPSK